MTRVQVPASTSNLGPGFDVVGLALKLYLRVTVSRQAGPTDSPFKLTVSGEGAGELSLGPDNLICRVMTFAAEREGVTLPPVELHLDNEIPLARGLGSSAAAIVAGLKLFEIVAEQTIPVARLLSYAVEFEGHADNISPALLGGLVVNSVLPNQEVLALKLNWPGKLKVLVVIPDFHLATSKARAVLPQSISRADAVFNLQRLALLVAALQEGRVEYLREAMRDRVHQPYRQELIPGLAEILDLPATNGLRGVALSGAGPTVLALVDEGAEASVSQTIIDLYARRGIKARALALAVDDAGAIVPDA